jgi:hypothetical protein
MSTERDPFYVGYHPTAPEAIARRVRLNVAALALVTAGAAVLLAASQRRADPGIFEYGTVRTLHGQIQALPYPALLVPGTGLTDRGAAYTRYLLVGEGKRGADPLVAGLDGKWVDLRGTRIARPGREMLEVASHGITEAAAGESSLVLPAPEPLGRLTLRGEIVDSKCWLGVMKPATGNVHRGCAARCLSGGIPPILMTTDDSGAVHHYLLTDSTGHQAPEWFAGMAGRTVEVTGEVMRYGDVDLMRIEKTVMAY